MNLLKRYNPFSSLSSLIFNILFSLSAFAQTQPSISLQAEATDQTTIVLHWNIPPGVTTLKLERKVDEGDFALLETITSPTDEYTDENLTLDASYTYRMYLETEELYSNEVTLSPNTYIPHAVKTGQDGNVLAPKYPDPEEKVYADLVTGVNYPVFQAPPCLEGTYWIGVQLHYVPTNIDTDELWEASLEIEFLHNSQVLWTRTLTNNMADQLFTQLVFHYEAIGCGENYYIKIKSKATDANIPQTDLYLSFILHRADAPTFESDMNISLNVVVNGGNLLSAGWTPEDDFLGYYDLEWVFIADHENFQGTTGAEAFAFKEGVRVSTATISYTHNFFYPTGKVWFRVRAVGIDPQYPDHRILGDWIHLDQGFTITNPETTLNWQANTTLAEEGKYKKVLQYYDGSLRNRQTLTNLSSENRTLVAESFYDFEGRPAVNVMPVPQTGINLAYQDNLNPFTASDATVIANTSATRLKFHYDNAILPNSILSTTSGAGKYYSSANDLSVTYKEYIPDAQGYAYAQQTYTRDASGRVSKQSGVGEAFQMDGNHTTRYFYGTASTKELVRLFGSDVGEASHYTKHLTVDPNGQVSVRYQDQEGRTIATALAGEKPHEVDGLPSYDALPLELTTVDISDKTLDDKTARIIQHTFLNESPNTNYDFTYHLSALASDVAIVGCQTCTYQLEISLIKPDGLPVDLSTVPGNEATEGLNFVKKGITAESCTTPTEENVNFSFVLADVGDYTLQKKLTVEEKTYQELKELLRTTASVQQKITELATTYVVDETDCDVCMDGEEAEKAINTAISEVSARECESILNEIIQDVMEQNNLTEEPDIEDPLVTGHPLHCKYELCVENQAGKEFERQIARFQNWSTATTSNLINDITHIEASDPFFSANPSYKTMVEAELANVVIGTVSYDSNSDDVSDGTNTLSGSLYDVTDPANTNFYLDDRGNYDVNGKHILYWDLMEKYENNEIDATEYNEQLDQWHWQHFKSFYLEAKRQVNIDIANQLSPACSTALAELELKDEIPVEQSALETWGKDKGITADISVTELEYIVFNIESACGIALDAQDRADVEQKLAAYFNENPYNFFRLIFTEDLEEENTHLEEINTILNAEGCDLDQVAKPNPMKCVDEEVVILENDIDYLILQQQTSSSATALQTHTAQENPYSPEEEAYLNHLKEEREKEMEARLEQEMEDILNKRRAEWARQDLLKTQSGISLMSSGTIISPEEYQALIDLYNSTDGPNWSNKAGWENADPQGDRDVFGWHGVTATNGVVTSINLSNNGLNGTIPASIGEFTNLQYLELDNNQLSGSIPAELGQLSSLQDLRLHNNQLSGSIPAELGQLSNLQYLELDNNQLSGNIPAELGQLGNLYLLYLYNNQLSGSIPVELGQLGNLQYLFLSNNQLSGSIPVELGQLGNLQYLGLDNNQLSGSIPVELGQLSNLQDLFLSNNQLSGSIPVELGQLSSLRYLWLFTNQLSGSVPVELGQLNNLQILYLHNNQLSGSIPTELGQLSNLRALYLYDNQLSGSIPTELGQLSNLQTLYLYRNQLSGSIPAELGQLSNLQHLRLYNNQLSGSIPAELGQLSNLQTLYLYNNQLSGSIPAELGQLSNLWELHLHNNQLSGSIPTELGQLSNLQYLRLPNNQLSGSIPAELGQLSNLQLLHLYNNQLSGSIPAELGQLSNLQTLYLYDNQLSGNIPVELGQLSNLQYLRLSNNQLNGSIPVELGQLSNLQTLYLYDNQFSGSIPTELGQLSNLNIFHFYNNQFTFSDILPFLQNAQEISIWYYPQAKVGQKETIVKRIGLPVTISTTIDNNTTPASNYTWYKDDIQLTSQPGLTINGPSIEFSAISEADEGEYHYTITNTDAPQLTLVSEPITLLTCDGNCDVYYVCNEYAAPDPINNPTLAAYTFDIDWDERAANCLSYKQEETDYLLSVATERLLEEEVTQYLRQGGTNCLGTVSETFSYSYIPKEYHYTLYYYDQAGNLVQTVPPKGVVPLTEAEIANNQPTAHTMKTRYYYNSLNQLVKQETPDAGKSEFWYDSKQQLRLSQNAQQAIQDGQTQNYKYSYTRYDALGRVIEVGELNTTETIAVLEPLLDDPTFPDVTTYTLNDITRTHYDVADENIAPIFAQHNLRNRVAWVEVIDDPADMNAEPVRTYYSYDAHGNVKALLQYLPEIGHKRTDYVYDLVSGNVNMVLYQYGASDQFIQKYKYDADNRLIEVKTSTDGYVWNKEANYSYYAHGPLARIELGENRVQGLDYYYTLQGWLKGVNMPGSQDAEDDPGADGMAGINSSADAMAFSLGYYEGDYQPIGSVSLSQDRNQLWQRLDDQYTQDPQHPYQGLYNGNIAWMETDLPGLDNNPMQAMLYRYDQLNRLVLARGLNQYDPVTGFAARGASEGPFDVDYFYDANGNLDTLKRYKQDGSVRDSLIYTYAPGTNRLLTLNDEYVNTVTYDEKVYNSSPLQPDPHVYRVITVQDAVTVEPGQSPLLEANESITLKQSFHAKAGSGFHARWTDAPNTETGDVNTDYTYDAIGNLITDSNEGTTITWTPYGKVRSVEKDRQTVTYRYDGAGNRIEKKVTIDDVVTTTQYVRDASGNVLAIYKDTTLIEQPVYGSSRLGQYRPQATLASGSLYLGQRQYELSNHLGNVLAVITDEIKVTNDLREPVIVQQKDYYPFGLGMEGRKVESEEYRYGFNGKEKDVDFQNNYDYGFRIYNPEIGKFLSVDPLTKSYPWYTPYQFAGNKPINSIDLDGLEEIKMNESGNLYVNYQSDGISYSHNPAPVMKFQAKAQLRPYQPNLASRIYSNVANNPDVPSPVRGAFILGYGIVDDAYVLVTKTASDFKMMNGARHLDNSGVSNDELFLSGVGTYGLGLTLLESSALKAEIQFANEIRASRSQLIKNKLPVDKDGKLLGEIVDGKFEMKGLTQAAGEFDFVVTAEGKTLLGRKHSFLSNGADVQAAGTLKIRSNKIVNVTNFSGHYQPSLNQSENFLNILKDNGVDVSSAHLKIYNGDGELLNHVTPVGYGK